MDTPWSYRWGTYKQHISRKEIEIMKKNMKKVPVIQLKTEIYHNKEINEAEKILGTLSSEPSTSPQISDNNQPTHHRFLSRFTSLRNRFISLF